MPCFSLLLRPAWRPRSRPIGHLRSAPEGGGACPMSSWKHQGGPDHIPRAIWEVAADIWAAESPSYASPVVIFKFSLTFVLGRVISSCQGSVAVTPTHGTQSWRRGGYGPPAIYFGGQSASSRWGLFWWCSRSMLWTEETQEVHRPHQALGTWQGSELRAAVLECAKWISKVSNPYLRREKA